MKKNRLKVCAGLMLMSGVMVPMWGNAGTLTVNADLITGSCELALTGNGKIDFGPHLAAEFNANNGVADVKSFGVQLVNCSLPPQGTPWNTYIEVKRGGGTALANGSDYVFTDNASSTTGFALRELDENTPQWTDSLGSFYDPSKFVDLSNKANTYQRNSGSTTDGSTLYYAVGFVRVSPQTTVMPEVVKATLTFTFMYN